MASPDASVTWWGHATTRLDLDGAVVLTDPLLTSRLGPLRRLGPVPPLEAYADAGLVLVSHAHHDHLDVPSLQRLPGSVPVVVPRGAAPVVARAGPREVVEVEPGSTWSRDGVDVEVVPARHDGRRWGSRWTSGAVGYVVDDGRHRVWFAGDTGEHPAMADLRGRVDVALLPIGGWGVTLGPGHLDARRAAEVCALVRPRLAVPVHWGTLALPWAHPDRSPLWRRQHGLTFAAHVARLAPGTHVVVPPVGTPVPLPPPA